MGESISELLSFHWPLLVTGILILFGLSFLIVSFCLDSKRRKEYERELFDKVNSVRVYVVNIPQGTVSYFNAINVGHVKRESLNEFYRHFPLSEQKRVMNWINAIADGAGEESDFLEVDVNDTFDKKQYFSMLQVDSVDTKRKILHLQSYLFKYMASSKMSSSGVNYHGLSTAKDFAKAMNAKGKKKGVSIVYRFLYKKTQKKDREIDPLVFNQLKNALSSLLPPKGFLIACSGNELMLSDTQISERAKALFLARSGLMLANRFLSLNALSSQIEVRCGAVEHYAYPSNAETIIAEAQKMAELAYEEEQSIVWYEKGKENQGFLKDSSYRTEVERIINEKKLAYSFRPIYAVKEGKPIGYFAKAEPKDTYFDSMEELKDYAARTQDDKELFTTVARNVIPLFVSERLSPEEKLFLSIRTEERSYLLSVFPRIAKAKEANLVFLFGENDLLTHMDPGFPNGINNDVMGIKAKGFEVALLLDKTELSLPSTVYSCFDYFVCSFANSGNASEMDARIRAKLHALVEKLLKYSKPIIATDIQGWGPIEILVRSGLDYISSQDFAPYDAMILPISQKAIRKVNDMKK